MNKTTNSSGKTVYRASAPMRRQDQPKYKSPKSTKKKRNASKEEVKTMRIRLVLMMIVCITPCVFSLVHYNELPEICGFHWDGQGNATFTTTRYFAAFGFNILAAVATMGVHYFSLHGNEDEANAFEALQWLMPIAANVYLPSIICINIQSNDYVRYLVPDLAGLVLVAVGIYFPIYAKEHFHGLPMPWGMLSPSTLSAGSIPKIRQASGIFWIGSGMLVMIITGLFYRYWYFLLLLALVLYLIPYLAARLKKQ